MAIGPMQQDRPHLATSDSNMTALRLRSSAYAADVCFMRFTADVHQHVGAAESRQVAGALVEHVADLLDDS